MQSASAEKKITFPLLLLCLYALAEYGRPPFLTPLHPGLVIQILLIILILKNVNKIKVVIKDIYFKLYMLLLIEMTVHVPISANNYWAYKYWYIMLSYLVVGLSFCLFVDNVHKFRTFLTVFLLIHVLCAMDEMITGGSYFGGSYFMAESNDFAVAMNTVIPISLLMGFSSRGFRRVGYWLATSLYIIANVLTFSRGGFIGMASVALCCWWSAKARVRNALILLIVGIAFFSIIPEGYKTELFSIKEENYESGTGRDRIELWKVAWRIFNSSPIIGVGQGNSTYILGDYQYEESGETSWKRRISGRAIHSLYFTILAELGIIGMLIFVFMIQNLYHKYRSIKKSSIENSNTLNSDEYIFLKNINVGLFVALIGCLVSGAFLSTFYYPQFWNLSALMTAIFMMKSRIAGKPQ